MSATHPRILATAGHVDHGKSALIKALTGQDPDRLPEEKARGITIDLGFAHVRLNARPVPTRIPSPEPTARGGDPAPDPAAEPETEFAVGIVDVPGHEDFVKNMVAGVGSIDAALLVVAADDRWMPQTEEHLQILSYLDVHRGVVAVTKIDLIPESAESAAFAEIKERLAGSPLADAPLVATSIVTGRGIDALRRALGSVLAQSPPPPDRGKPRLAVDRAFTLRGIGTVVTGTLSGGSLNRGQQVILQPGNRSARIRTVHNHNREVPDSPPGTRTALNLPDMIPSHHAGAAGNSVQRGDVVTLADLGQPASILDVLVHRSPRLKDSSLPGARPLRNRTRVRVHHGSANVAARIDLSGQSLVEPGQTVIGRLRLESPLFVWLNDRLIIRDWSEEATLAGATVLDPSPPKRRNAAHRKMLSERADAAGASDPKACLQSLIDRDGVSDRGALLVQSSFSQHQIDAALSELAAAGAVMLSGKSVMQAGWWQTQRALANQTVDQFHLAHPEKLGLPLNELRTALKKSTGNAEVLDALILDLERNGFVRTGTVIRRTTHAPALPPNLRAAGTRIRNALSLKPLEPPSRKDLAPDSASAQALRFLVDTGEAIELGSEVALLADVHTGMRRAVANHLRTHHHATASELRKVVGTSRRILIPLLEQMDRDGITVRDGDQRRLRPQK